MGDPWFKLAPRAKEWGLVALSSNYELYGDISTRVMELLGRYSAWLEVSSIDEAFLGVKGDPDELAAMGRSMKAVVRRHVGVPVCVGIAPTKTLAKLANKWAKNNKAFSGVCHRNSVPAAEREALLGHLSVEEVWGIAGRLTRRLDVMGNFTIADLVRADPVAIRDKFSVVMMRTVLELRARPAFPWKKNGSGGTS
jgi:DNA polymerase V